MIRNSKVMMLMVLAGGGRKLGFAAVLLLGGLWTATAVSAADPKEAEKAIDANAQAFVAAFNNADAVALAAFWLDDADYVDQAGVATKGKKELEKAYKKVFAERKGAKLAITVSATRVVKDDLVIQDGITEIVSADGGPPTIARFSAVHVKQDGKWLLASVRDSVARPPSNFEHLQDLDWLTGDWQDDADSGEVAKVAYSWADNQNFLVSSLTTSLKDIPVGGSTQWIGWDAANKQIRSWTFDASGGFSEGSWSGAGGKWSIKTTITARDGKKIAVTNIIAKTDADHFTWQSTKRTVDGNAIPDSEVVKMKRVKAK